MKWLLVLSLALLVRGDGLPPMPPSIDMSGMEPTLPPTTDDIDEDSYGQPEHIVEPVEVVEINYDGVMPEPPVAGGKNGTDEPDHVRIRRYITTSTTLWPNRNVVYSYTPGAFPSEGSKSAIKFSIEYLVERTCLTFNEVDQATYTASHVKFVVGTGCWADLGYNPNYNTRCSCCSKGTCYHEMLHLLGFMHEHQRPDRDRYIEVDLLRVDPGKWSQFSKLPESSVSYTDKRIYKVASTMHYSGWAFQKDLFGSSIKTVNDDYILAEDFYYPIREVNIRYNCQQAKCADFTTECVNDGYVTEYLGVCRCVCPEGLSSEDGCSKAITSGNSVQWPSGSYAFVAAGTGCPPGFNIGYRKHWSAGFSWAQAGENPMKGVQDYSSTEYEFCVSRNNFDQSNNKWPAGVYCLHRVGGTCPEGFNSGTVQLDDWKRSSSYYQNIKTGDLPDGEFGDDTKFEFCCRTDGLKTIPIELPATNEFVLYNSDNTVNPECQQVKNFNSRKYYFSYHNYQDGSTTVASLSGSRPFTYNYGITYLFYICHYTPLDLSCGGTIELDSNNPTQSFSTPNYPSNYGSNKKCNWLITAPEGSKVYLDFDSTFDVHCSDSVEVRVLNIGEMHGRFCRHNGKTFRSYSNKMTVMFTSSATAEAGGFQANVRYLTNEDNCYDFEDDGASYRGNAQVTKYFEPCLPWNETSNCEYSSQHPQYASAGLDNNYCRNPGSADRPWCYTDATDCTRRVCDVCQQGNVHDTYSDCQNLISTVPNFCSQDPRAAGNCRLSCIGDHPLPAKPAARSSVSCSPPTTVPSDGTADVSKTSYNVGDTITYTCNDNPDSSVTMTCSIDGEFDAFVSACKMCDDGWLALNGICYFKEPSPHTYNNGRTTCENKGAKLIMPKGKVASDFLAHNRNDRETWIGANDIATEGVWRWLDNTIIAPEDIHFGSGHPSNASTGHDCATQLSIRNSLIWVDKACSATNTYYNVICEKPGRSDTCHDVIADCAERASQDSQFCNPANGFSSLYCRGYCGCEQECGEGGTMYNGQCYYKQTPKVQANQAMAACAAMGGVLPSVKSPADNVFINTLYHIQWIGLNDIQTEGEFVWPDGSPQGIYNLWLSGYPNNFYNSDCVLSHYSRWLDRYCTVYNAYNYVCVKDEIASCDVPTASANSITVTTASKLYSHEELVTQCVSGYMATSGDLTRYCLTDGSFSGSAPVCEDETSANVITPSNKVSLKARGQKISTLQGYLFSGDYDDFLIPRAGEIISWEFFSVQSGNVALMVFRNNGTDFKLVGFNYITTQGSSAIHSIYNVPIADRIDVEKGDKIGIWFPEDKQVIEVNFHEDSLEWRYPQKQIRRSFNSYTSTTDLVIGSTYAFYVSNSNTAEARTLFGSFSLRANIGPRT